MEGKLSVKDLQRDTYTICLTQMVQRVQSFLALRQCNYDRWTRMTWQVGAGAPQRVRLRRRHHLRRRLHRGRCWLPHLRGHPPMRLQTFHLASSPTSAQTFREAGCQCRGNGFRLRGGVQQQIQTRDAKKICYTTVRLHCSVH